MSGVEGGFSAAEHTDELHRVVELGHTILRIEGPNLRRILVEDAAKLVKDIGEHEAFVERLRLALIDPVTELKNINGLKDEKPRFIARAKREDTQCLLAVADLDGLKEVNDIAGHLLGNQYLQASAKAMTSSVRLTDGVYRVGGDEFVMLVEGMGDDVNPEALQDILRERLAGALESAITDSPELDTLRVVNGLDLTASVGLTMWDPRSEDYDDAFVRADAAMYQHKRDEH